MTRINTAGRNPLPEADRKNVIVTIRMTAAQADHLRTRAEAEGYDPAALRPFVIASMLLGIAHTPVGEYSDRLRRLQAEPEK